MFGIGFLDALHEELVKTGFRRRAFETHPDRAGCAGLDPLVLTHRFQEVHAAKELLNRFLADRDTAPLIVAPMSSARAKAPSAPQRRPAPSRPAASRPSASRTPQAPEYFWRGLVPDRQLPIGEYLYYSGRISMQALISAIHAQRVQRPLFGQLAAQWGFLTLSSVTQLMSRKRIGERVGDAALRLGLLTPYQRDVILGSQRAKQRLFGAFFTDTGVLSPFALSELVRAQRLHNFGRAARRAS